MMGAGVESVGMTHVEGTVTGPGGQQATVLFLVDGGAIYTLLPHQIWQVLGLGATRSVAFSSIHLLRFVSTSGAVLPTTTVSVCRNPPSPWLHHLIRMPPLFRVRRSHAR